MMTGCVGKVVIHLKVHMAYVPIGCGTALGVALMLTDLRADRLAQGVGVAASQAGCIEKVRLQASLLTRM